MVNIYHLDSTDSNPQYFNKACRVHLLPLQLLAQGVAIYWSGVMSLFEGRNAVPIVSENINPLMCIYILSYEVSLQVSKGVWSYNLQ